MVERTAEPLTPPLPNFFNPLQQSSIFSDHHPRPLDGRHSHPDTLCTDSVNLHGLIYERLLVVVEGWD